MQQILYVIIAVVYYFLAAMELLMFIRALLSWVMPDEDSAFTRFVIGVTEPVIIPIRAVLDRIEFLRELPIDISFTVAFMLLAIVRSILPAVSI